MDNVFLITVADIKKYTQLHGNVDDKLVAPEIIVCQDMHIRPLLGKAFYDKLIAGKKAATLSSQETAFLSGYVEKCLMYYVLSELPEGITLQLTNAGMANKTTERTSPASMSEMVQMSKHFLSRAQNYAQLMIDYLQENASATLFPEYLQNSCKAGPSDNAYTCSIVL